MLGKHVIFRVALAKSAVSKCCKEVLWKKCIGKDCCREMLETRVVEKCVEECCTQVWWKRVGLNWG